MRSPVDSKVIMQPRELEPGLHAFECPQSGGFWIPLQAYLAWRDEQPDAANSEPELHSDPVQDDSGRKALLCPESGRLLLRYRVGQGLAFHVDRSPQTGGVWLDKGEWEALESRGLHVALHLVFTASYQRRMRSTSYERQLENSFRERIGSSDFDKVLEFGRWLAEHSGRRDILCFLLDLSEATGEIPVIPART